MNKKDRWAAENRARPQIVLKEIYINILLEIYV